MIYGSLYPDHANHFRDKIAALDSFLRVIETGKTLKELCLLKNGPISLFKCNRFVSRL